MELIKSINNISLICDKYNSLIKTNGENYNVFKVIGLMTNEVRVHSAFLANLLSPNEKHGFGAEFLELFLQQLEIGEFDAESAKVNVEFNIGPKTNNSGGILDIRIRDNNDYLIVIENKIHAGDQENQMVRYYNYVKSSKEFKLYYLTLDGSMPNESFSCTDVINNYKLEVGKDYELVSYAFDIKCWLEKCREKATNYPLLREGISHYINLIDHLTNQTMSSSLKNEVKQELLKKDNILNLSLFKESIIEAEKELQLQFWNTLKAKFKASGYEVVLDNYQDNIHSYYYTTRNNKNYGFEIVVKDNVNYGIRIDRSLYGGFTAHFENSNNRNNESRFEIIRNKIMTLSSKFSNDNNTNIYWLGWKLIMPDLDFKVLDRGACEYLVNMNETAYMIFKEVDNDIKELKELLT